MIIITRATAAFAASSIQSQSHDRMCSVVRHGWMIHKGREGLTQPICFSRTLYRDKHMATSRIRRRQMSSRVESSHITSHHMATDLSHYMTAETRCRVESHHMTAETRCRVESSRVTSHGDRPLASRRKLSSRVTSHGDLSHQAAERCRLTGDDRSHRNR